MSPTGSNDQAAASHLRVTPASQNVSFHLVAALEGEEQSPHGSDASLMALHIILGMPTQIHHLVGGLMQLAACGIHALAELVHLQERACASVIASSVTCSNECIEVALREK